MQNNARRTRKQSLPSKTWNTRRFCRYRGSLATTPGNNVTHIVCLAELRLSYCHFLRHWGKPRTRSWPSCVFQTTHVSTAHGTKRAACTTFVGKMIADWTSLKYLRFLLLLRAVRAEGRLLGQPATRNAHQRKRPQNLSTNYQTILVTCTAPFCY